MSIGTKGGITANPLSGKQFRSDDLVDQFQSDLNPFGLYSPPLAA
jgi:hypothetical protein